MNAWTTALAVFQRPPQPRIMDEEETKPCAKCGTVKPLSSFYLRITENRPDHYSANCRVCQRAAEKLRRGQQRNAT